jgi:hypothetical protein
MSIRRWTGPLLLAAILAAAALAVAGIGAPALPRTEPRKTEFSAERAWRHVEEIARAPHPVGTAEHDRVRSYVLRELEDLGLEVDTLSALSHVRWGSSVRSALTRNVMARLPGAASTGAVVLVSHYDGAPLAPAAGDAGIGVATVLEAARALAIGDPTRNDVIFLLTDAEELGLLGARAFAAEHPWMDDVAFVLNFEARGTSGAAVMFETGPGSGWAVRELGRAGRRAVAWSIIPEAYARLPNDTDFSVFRGMGLPGLNFAIAGSAHWYHTPGDSPENLSPASLQHMGDNGLAMARLLADSDLTAAPAGERVYFHVPGLGLMGYGPGWAVPLAILLLAAFLATTVLAARRGRLRWWALPVGLLAALVALVLSVLVPHWLWSSLQGRHPEWGAIVGRALYREWPYALAMVALATVAVTGIFGLLRRWVGLEGLSLGALVLPLTGAVASAALLPAGSYLLLWPSLLAVGMVTLLTVIPTGEPVPARADPAPDGVVEPDPGARASRRRLAGLRAVLVLGGLGILLIMIPVLFLVHVMLSIAVAPLLGATAALLALLLLPLLDMLSRPNRWWLPATGLVAAGAFLALGASATVGTPERPAPGNLLHLQDDLSGTSLWASPAYHDDPFTAALLADAPDTLRLDAYSWTLRGGRYRAAPAPSWPAPPVRATVLEDREAGGTRRLRLRLTWADPPMVAEVWPTGGETRLVEPAESGAEEDADKAPSPPPGAWRLLRAGLDWPLELVVEGPAGELAELVVSAIHAGLPPRGDGVAAARPGGVMAVPAYRWSYALSDVRVVRETLSF